MPVTYSDVTLTSFTSPSSALPTVTAMPSCSLPNGTGQLLADYGYDGLSACDAVTAGMYDCVCVLVYVYVSVCMYVCVYLLLCVHC